jgi:hypothetical protein
MRDKAAATRWPGLLIAAALCFGLLLFSPLGVARAATTTTLTFDELATQPVDGLNFSGVTFHFDVAGAPSSDANYASFGPGTTTYVQDPSLEGNAAGTLTLAFDQPVTALEFGVALSTNQTLTPGFSVELFSPGGSSLGVTPVDTAVTSFPFTEGKFTYSGAPVGRAVVTFSAQAARFALDNLKFTTGPAQPVSKDQCKKGGYKAFGFRNQGQCIKAVHSS